MKTKHYSRLKEEVPKYKASITSTITIFGGPSLYFHQKALEWQQKDFLSDKHIEYVYAMLVSWGMHRMGARGAKMPDYETFKESILSQKEKLDNLRYKSIENIKQGEEIAIIKTLSDICFSIKGTTSKSYIVSSSKTLAHILPNLVCPIDRQYTCQFFEVSNKEPETKIFEEVIKTMWSFYQDPDRIQLLSPILGKPFNENYPKIFDNLIIEYVKVNFPKIQKKKQKK